MTGFGSLLSPAESLREQVEGQLASRIVSGEIPPGQVLTVPTLAGDFGVSATPVREAMLNLARRGFLRPIRNRGFEVTEVSPDELRELTEVRMLLEAPPMRQVAGTLDDATVTSLRETADRIVNAAKTGQFDEYLASDTEFHLRILQCTGNHKLVETVRELRQQTRLVGLVRLAETDALISTSLEHAELVDLLVAGRGEEAEALMRRHIHHVGGVWSGHEEE
ncbi:GntR family transcriptional regulator [Microbacterium arabinogalactanolyticum]|uniref:GntR family transcriptional regulator n=1 Tax=Microbacterium arabinogalactanolyticum TaxID=69365 RepID=UPI00255419B8|nr:GntR family transcriptional regulator [Microbacterium arabinogalactanolyticum]GLC86321.1 GntR family transcriptional regulator [Microbacterium arabinogalactanolyticum]